MNLESILIKLKEASVKIKDAASNILDKLDQLSNRQLSLIITCCLMGLFLLTLLNIQMAAKQEEEFLYELSFDEEFLEVIPTEELSMTELETHKAYNQAMKSDYADELDNFKTLEELEQQAQQAASQDPDYNNSEIGELSNQGGFASEYAEKLKEQRERLEAIKRRGEAPKINVKRRTTITYSMVDRMHSYLANPVYTCESFGKVVINVKVNSSGRVIDATYNQSSSNTKNGCLVENAIKYALQSRFDPKPGSEEQVGSITYLFQG
ncbi:hypothetical protein I215_07122 [Galbibacter marinus]|uniref:TonB family protein n=1 Tax=Galbibacter marinus TaxID=555500 RepID=K2Q3L6_9FLAO|nr:hypothetical protein [Galbibacter marinus]EKF55461.1 hypothetical protein I215_07122 [Galbibacter marinus]